MFQDEYVPCKIWFAFCPAALPGPRCLHPRPVFSAVSALLTNEIPEGEEQRGFPPGFYQMSQSVLGTESGDGDGEVL